MNIWNVKQVTRHFRMNEGTTDYISIPEITLSADFKIKITIERDTTKATSSLGGPSSTRCYQQVDGRLELANASGGVFFTGALTGIPNGALFTVTMERIGPLLTAEILGVTYNGTTDNTGAYSFTRIGTSNNITNSTTGVIANVEFYDAGALIRSYPINDNSDAILDTVGGQTGAVIGGVTGEAWGLFHQVVRDGKWQGISLHSPEWSSSNQILEVS
tara:strand:- start:7070 stop:7720 length:651 start_codon:yes stop_codon:yes gene_type:complete